MHYSFEISDAQKYGVDEAIFIQNLRFWILKNKASGKHEYDGKTWTYNSAQAFAKLFPFWTNRQVERITKSLKDKNIVTTGNYNSSHYDRTLWYAFCDENLFLNGVVADTQSQNSIYANAEIKKHDQVNLYQIINTDNKTDNIYIGDSAECADKDTDNCRKTKSPTDYTKNELFCRFYAYYPNKQKPRDAYKAFLKLKPDEELVQKIIEDLEDRVYHDIRWQDRKYIPYPATYLNSEYWEGDIVTLDKKPNDQRSR